VNTQFLTAYWERSWTIPMAAAVRKAWLTIASRGAMVKHANSVFTPRCARAEKLHNPYPSPQPDKSGDYSRE